MEKIHYVVDKRDGRNIIVLYKMYVASRQVGLIVDEDQSFDPEKVVKNWAKENDVKYSRLQRL